MQGSKYKIRNKYLDVNPKTSILKILTFFTLITATSTLMANCQNIGDKRTITRGAVAGIITDKVSTENQNKGRIVPYTGSIVSIITNINNTPHNKPNNEINTTTIFNRHTEKLYDILKRIQQTQIDLPLSYPGLEDDQRYVTNMELDIPAHMKMHNNVITGVSEGEIDEDFNENQIITELVQGLKISQELKKVPELQKKEKVLPKKKGPIKLENKLENQLQQNDLLSKVGFKLCPTSKYGKIIEKCCYEIVQTAGVVKEVLSLSVFYKNKFTGLIIYMYDSNMDGFVDYFAYTSKSKTSQGLNFKEARLDYLDEDSDFYTEIFKDFPNLYDRITDFEKDVSLLIDGSVILRDFKKKHDIDTLVDNFQPYEEFQP
tara:strand:- start:154 stop:1275 length:1122 start_codon:yes stop_codon:yes gene_type:complete